MEDKKVSNKTSAKKRPSFSIVETIIINPKVNGNTIRLQFFPSERFPSPAHR